MMNRRAVLSLSSVAIATSVAGCTGLRTRLRELRLGKPVRRVAADWQPAPGQWPMDGYDHARTKSNPFATPPRTEPEPAWTYDESGGVDSLVVIDGTVFVRTESALAAVDATDGSERWRRPRDGSGSLKYVAGRLYDIRDHSLRALDPDGTEQWSTALDEAYYFLLERDGWVMLCARDSVIRLHADTGDVVSEAERDAYGPATDGGLVYAGKFDVSAFEFEDGEFVTQWTADDEEAYESAASVVYSGDRLYRVERTFPSRESIRLTVYDATDGSQLTTVPFDRTPLSPAADGNSVYVSSSILTAGSVGADGRLVALSEDGDERWRFDPGAGLRSPVVADGTVYVGPFANDRVPLVAFDAATGEELWRREVPGTPELAVAGDTLYVGTSDGVHALREASQP